MQNYIHLKNHFSFEACHTGNYAQFFAILTTMFARADNINCLAVSENGVIVSGSSDKSVKIFQIDTCKEIHSFSDAHTGLKCSSST